MPFLPLILIGVLVTALAASAQPIPEILTEDDAVRIAQSSPSVALLSAAQLDLARSDIDRERRWPNPAVEYTREAAGDTEQFLTLTQSFDVSGRRTLRRRAAELRLEAAQHVIASRRLDLARIVRSEFNRASSQQELVRALTEWSKRIAESAATAARLEAGGEVSGYDRRRLERERIGAEARLATEQGALAAAQRRLAALLGINEIDGVTLQRTAPEEIPPDAELSARVEQRPDIAALDRRIEAAKLDRRAAERGRAPLFDVTAGMKDTEVENGSVLGLAVSLPLFNRNQPDILRAAAEESLLTAERSILLARARGEVEGLAAEARQLRYAARLFRDQALPTSARLTATAEAAYRAGEVGILELLDAYRSAVEAEVEAAQLDNRAREAEIELAGALGGISR